MPRSNGCITAEKLCQSRACMSAHEIHDLGSSANAVVNCKHSPCSIFEFELYGVRYVCPEGARAPVEVLALKHAVEYALERERGGYCTIYKSYFKDLPRRPRMRVLQLLGLWANKNGCIAFKKFYKCPKEAVAVLNDTLNDIIERIRGYDVDTSRLFLDIVKDTIG